MSPHGFHRLPSPHKLLHRELSAATITHVRSDQRPLPVFASQLLLRLHPITRKAFEHSPAFLFMAARSDILLQIDPVVFNSFQSSES